MKNKEEMINSMLIEIKKRKNYLNKKTINTVYFGGGSPSILNTTEIEKFLNTIKDTFDIKENAEITMECNPDDLTKKKLLRYKNIGVNRLSIGVQSLNDDDLKFMNRAHNSEEAIKSIKLAKETGFNNITVDLIYGLPGQTLKKWAMNLDVILTLGIQHFSAYCLTVEKKTTLYHLIKNKKVQLLDDKKVIKLFDYLQKKAKSKGFVHYEISNFGKEQFFSKHNTNYWKNKHYLGIGPSAHSYNGESRRWNVCSNKKYISNVKKNISYFEEEILTLSEKYNEYIFMSLRSIWGADNMIIKKRYGEKRSLYFLNEIRKWEEKKYVTSNNTIYQLTKKGKNFADKIASDLFLLN